MRWIWVMAVLGMSLAGFSQETQQDAKSADLSKNARLQKRITLWYPIEPLPEVLKSVQKQTGVRFICPDRFRNEKVAIFVENRPAHEVLTRLAEVFRIEWQEEGGEYRVERSSEEVRLEEEALRVMREVRRKALSEYLDMLRRVMSMKEEERERRREALEQKHKAQGSKNLQRSEILELSFLNYLIAKKVRGISDFIDIFLATLPKQEVERLLNGQLLVYSTHPTPDVGTIPFALVERHYSLLEAYVNALDPEERPWHEYLVKERPIGVSLGFRLSQITNHLLCQYSDIQNTSEEEIEQEDCRCEVYRLGIYASAGGLEASKAPLFQRWSQWAEPAKDLAEWLRAKRPIPDRMPFPPGWHPKRVPKDPYYSHSYRDIISAKFLELLDWRDGIPIIADSFRTSWNRFSNEDGESAWLERLLGSYWLRREGDYLLGRRRNYWAWRSAEPEETVLRALETKFQNGQDLTVDDYAQFVATLNEHQYNYLLEMTLTSYLPIAVEIPQESFYLLPLLKFWATLTPQQRASVLAGEFLPARTMNPAQRKAFAHAVEPLFPHPRRVMVFPCTTSCSVFSIGGHSLFYDLQNTTARAKEEGFALVRPSEKEIREVWYTEDGSSYWVWSSSRDWDGVITLDDDRRIVRRERYEEDVYLFEFFALPQVVVRYQFINFVLVKSDPKSAEEKPNP